MTRQTRPPAQIVTGQGYVGFVLPGTPKSVATARMLTRRALGTGGQADSAVTCVSELVTNAIMHTRSGRPGGAVHVSLHRDPDWSVVVSVTDEGIPPGQPPAGRPRDERGRGLAIVEVLSDSWGVVPLYGTARQTWCRLAPTDPRHRTGGRPLRGRKGGFVMAHTVQLKLAIAFDDAQLAAYAQMHQLQRPDGQPLMAKDYVDSAQVKAVEVLAASGQFAGAQITLKR